MAKKPLAKKAELSSAAILLLGGDGIRYGSSIPKQYVDMGGKPLFLYAYETLSSSPYIGGILLVVKKGYEKKTKELISDKSKLLGVIKGGETREESSYQGLIALNKLGAGPYTMVYIHDADRPLLSLGLIEALYKKAEKDLFALPALPVSDSLAYAPNGERIEHYGDRRGNYTVQTPQVAAYSLYLKSFMEEKENLKYFTDDASVILKAMGMQPSIVKGESTNIKVNDRESEALFLTLLRGMKG